MCQLLRNETISNANCVEIFLIVINIIQCLKLHKIIFLQYIVLKMVYSCASKKFYQWDWMCKCFF